MKQLRDSRFQLELLRRVGNNNNKFTFPAYIWKIRITALSFVTQLTLNYKGYIFFFFQGIMYPWNRNLPMEVQVRFLIHDPFQIEVMNTPPKSVKSIELFLSHSIHGENDSNTTNSFIYTILL